MQRKSDSTCDTCSTSSSQQSPSLTPSPPLSSAPTAEQISHDSTFSVLQLNANGFGNKLTELGVVRERNKVKVSVLQELFLESKLSPKSKNPCIRNFTRIHKDRPHGLGGGLLILIHRSITFSKQRCCFPRLGPSSSQSRFLSSM